MSGYISNYDDLDHRGASQAEYEAGKRDWESNNKLLNTLDELDREKNNEVINLSPQPTTPAPAPATSTPAPKSDAGWTDGVNWGGRTTKTVMKTVRTPWGFVQRAVAAPPKPTAPTSFATAVQQQQDAKVADDKAKTKEMVEANRKEATSVQDAKTLKRRAIADSNIEIYRGLVTAFDALNSTNESISGDIDGITRDITTGYRKGEDNVRRGFVGKGVISDINNAMRRSGNNIVSISAIVAVKDGEGKDPYFVVRGTKNKDKSKFEQVMTLDDVANFARKNYSTSSNPMSNIDNELVKDFATTKWSDYLLSKMRTGLQSGGSNKASVEAARIRAASNEAVARMNNQTKIDLAKLTDKQKREIAEADRKLKEFGITTGLQEVQETNASREKVAQITNQGKIDVVKLTGEQKKELANAANALKKYGIDIGYKETQETNASREKIEAAREAGRQARAVMRDNQAWEKLAIDWAKTDNDFAVKMSRADTYGKRVDLIEEKLKKDYEVAMKNAKTAEQRAETEKVYKERMADVAEGNIDLNWFKAETAADQGQQKIDQTAEQKEKDRQTRERIAGLITLTSNGSLSRNLSANQLKTYNDQLTALSKALNTNELGSEEYNNVIAKINAIANDIAKAQQSTQEQKEPPPTEGARKQFKQGWATFRNGKWVLEGK